MNYYFVTFRVPGLSYGNAEGNFVIEGDFEYVKEAENIKEKHGLVETPFISGIFAISESMYKMNKK